MQLRIKLAAALSLLAYAGGRDDLESRLRLEGGLRDVHVLERDAFAVDLLGRARPVPGRRARAHEPLALPRQPAVDRQEVEVVVNSFSFVPAA